jgi:hypothetical protein
MAMKHEATPNFAGVCEGCGTKFIAYVRPHKNPRRFCSQACGQKSMIGTKQSAIHIAKRVQRGDQHGHWKGDGIAERSGRTRALRLYPKTPGCCDRCGQRKRLDRHHEDENTANNSPENIAFLCRRCHMTVDGRITKMNEVRMGHGLS